MQQIAQYESNDAYFACKSSYLDTADNSNASNSTQHNKHLIKFIFENNPL